MIHSPAVSTPPEPDRRIWIDGELVPWGQATVHVLSHSLQRGSLIFDYTSVHETARGPAVFRLAEHLERFERSAELVALPLARSRDELFTAVAETVRANPGARAVKISAYFPSIEVDVVPADAHVAVAIAAYDPARDVLAYKQNPYPFKPTLSLWVEKERRNRRYDIVPPQAKVAANYTSSMYAKWAARKAGYDEIVLVDEHGHLAEGPTTNLFLVDREGVLCTPVEEKVLLGVTRRSVLELAKHEGLPVREDRIPPDALFQAPEVFLTGTTAGVWPVHAVDGQAVGASCPGPVTTRLKRRFDAVTAGGDPDFEHWLTFVDEV